MGTKLCFRNITNIITAITIMHLYRKKYFMHNKTTKYEQLFLEIKPQDSVIEHYRRERKSCNKSLAIYGKYIIQSMLDMFK